LEIREIRPEEREAAFYVGSQAFMQGGRDMSFLDHPDKLARRTFGIWDEGGLQAMAGVLDYRIQLGTAPAARMGGVAAVACLPASRGKGYAADCLRYTLERMREEGQSVSVLHPFSFEFYDRLGWAWVGVQRTYEVRTRALKPAPETESVRAATQADRAAIVAAYTEFSRRYRGPIARCEKHWNTVLNSSDKEYRYTYVYERSGHVEGYLTYMGGKRESTRLRELVALTPAARRGLLGLLRRHEMQIDQFVWTAPADDGLWSTLMHWDTQTRLQPVAQGRIVDLPAAIAAWQPDAQAEGSVAIEVLDVNAPWNAGRWRLEFGGGSARAERTGAEPQVALDIRELSQAYFGTPSLAELHREDAIDVRDATGFASLAALLEGPPMWMNDPF